MTSIQTIFLGIIQGLTEFLPVSSSGHLVLSQNLLGLREPELLLDTSLHVGTLVAVCLYFRSDLKKIVLEILQEAFQFFGTQKNLGTQGEKLHASLALWIAVGSIPTALIGLLFRSPLERLFGSVSLVGFMLITTGMVLFATRFVPSRYSKRREIGFLIALAIGTAQGLAIIPGISRSGATIACGLVCGLERDLAGRFSFLLSLPAIIGALLLQLSGEALEKVALTPLLLGFVSAALVGLLSLRILMNMVRQGHLSYFAPYCWATGLVALSIVH